MLPSLKVLTVDRSSVTRYYLCKKKKSVLNVSFDGVFL